MLKSSNVLNQAISSFDLPAYLQQHYPGCLSGPIKTRGWNLGRAVWRGDSNPSFGLIRQATRWFYRDFATGQQGSILDFLLDIEGRNKHDAIAYIVGNPGRAHSINWSVITEPKHEVRAPKPASTKTAAMLQRAQQQLEHGLPLTLRWRGIDDVFASAFGLGRNNEETLIPLHEPAEDGYGPLLNVKIRHVTEGDVTRWRDCQRVTEEQARQLAAQTRVGRYSYAESGGAVCWYSPSLLSASEAVIVVEGEFKAMVAWAALFAVYGNRYGVIGLPGASAKLPVHVIQQINKPIYIIPDMGVAGEDALRRWSKTLEENSIIHHACDPMPDLCDLAVQLANDPDDPTSGLERLAARLIQEMNLAANGYTRRRAREVAKQKRDMLDPKKFPGRAGSSRMQFIRFLLSEVVQNKFVTATNSQVVVGFSRNFLRARCGIGSLMTVDSLIRWAQEMGLLCKVDRSNRSLYKTPWLSQKAITVHTSFYYLDLPILDDFIHVCTVTNIRVPHTFVASPEHSPTAVRFGAKLQILTQAIIARAVQTVQQAAAYMGVARSTARRYVRIIDNRLGHTIDQMPARPTRLEQIRAACYNARKALADRIFPQHQDRFAFAPVGSLAAL